tara:strand:- start:858 stop:1289 length:432 start_codon:yes stop_codon:yes gene_type:complete
MNNFNGAVMVDSKKIRDALYWNKTYYNYNNKRMRELKKLAKEHVKSWSRLKRWFNNDGYYDDLDFSIFVGKYVNMFDSLEDGYLSAGLICEKEHKVLRYHSYSCMGTYHDLLSMINCGEPVYLNPEQARLVNDWTFNVVQVVS